MYLDVRGGYNRKPINKDFFKKWSPEMSYLLGLICADGAVEDVRYSSRTCYLTLTSKDKSLILDVKRILNSSHKIYTVNEHFQKFDRKYYLCSKKYILRVGSKEIFQDLINLGLRPRKALRMFLPEVPLKFFNFYVRGYFDGDGCVNVHKSSNKNKEELCVIFTSGCKSFLENLSKTLKQFLKLKGSGVYPNSGAYRLKYRKLDSLKILKYIYKDLSKSPYLERKHNIYRELLRHSPLA